MRKVQYGNFPRSKLGHFISFLCVEPKTTCKQVLGHLEQYVNNVVSTATERSVKAEGTLAEVLSADPRGNNMDKSL